MKGFVAFFGLLLAGNGLVAARPQFSNFGDFGGGFDSDFGQSSSSLTPIGSVGSSGGDEPFNVSNPSNDRSHLGLSFELK